MGLRTTTLVHLERGVIERRVESVQPKRMQAFIHGQFMIEDEKDGEPRILFRRRENSHASDIFGQHDVLSDWELRGGMYET